MNNMQHWTCLAVRISIKLFIPTSCFTSFLISHFSIIEMVEILPLKKTRGIAEMDFVSLLFLIYFLVNIYYLGFIVCFCVAFLHKQAGLSLLSLPTTNGIIKTKVFGLQVAIVSTKVTQLNLSANFKYFWESWSILGILGPEIPCTLYSLNFLPLQLYSFEKLWEFSRKLHCFCLNFRSWDLKRCKKFASFEPKPIFSP